MVLSFKICSKLVVEISILFNFEAILPLSPLRENIYFKLKSDLRIAGNKMDFVKFPAPMMAALFEAFFTFLT